MVPFFRTVKSREYPCSARNCGFLDQSQVNVGLMTLSVEGRRMSMVLSMRIVTSSESTVWRRKMSV